MIKRFVTALLSMAIVLVFTIAAKPYLSDNIETTSQLATYTPAEGEIIVDKTKKTLVVGDGSTKGGIALVSESAIVDTARALNTTRTIFGQNFNGTANVTGQATVTGLNPSSDSTTAVQVFKADGTTPVMTIDTTNNNISIRSAQGTEKAPALETINWTVGTNWAVGSGIATRTSGATLGAITPSDTTNIVAGTTYKIAITFSAVSGNIFVGFGGQTAYSISTSGTYNYYITAITTAKVTFAPFQSSDTCTISSISIIPIIASTGDLTVNGSFNLNGNIRSTNGTQFSSTSTNGEFQFISGTGSGSKPLGLYSSGIRCYNTGTFYQDYGYNGAARADLVVRTSLTSALNGLAYRLTAVGLGIDITPTAYITLKAGTAAAGTSPLKVTLASAVLNSTPEAGAIEPDSTGNLYMTNSSAVRRGFAVSPDTGVTVDASKVVNGYINLNIAGTNYKVMVTN